jgi:hypothetical protein
MQSVKLLQNMVSNALHTLHPIPATTVCINCTLRQGREKRGRVELEIRLEGKQSQSSVENSNRTDCSSSL